MLSCRLFRLARTARTSLDALTLSRSAFLSLSSSCNQEKLGSPRLLLCLSATRHHWASHLSVHHRSTSHSRYFLLGRGWGRLNRC